MSKYKNILFAGIWIILFVTLPPLGFILMDNPKMKMTQGYAQTYEQTNADFPYLLKKRLPASAKRIVYRSFPEKHRASFDIIEQQFLSWIDQQEYEKEEIFKPQNIYMVSRKNDRVVETKTTIEEGYVIQEEVEKEKGSEASESLNIYFDSEADRCYFDYGTE